MSGMYRHKCEAAQSADYPRGITITAKVLANLKPIEGDERVFWVNDTHSDLFSDQSTAESLYCLDCDNDFARVVVGLDLVSVESMLSDGELSEVEWVEE
jgi:hypothetical protein